jgi:phospholipase/carboxylesterase
MTRMELPPRVGDRPRATATLPHSQLDQRPASTRDLDAGPAEAFLFGREFCHGHAGGDSSLHAALPPRPATAARRAGWAEPHYLARTGQAPPSIIMLYAPRDEAEREVILQLVRASYEFALGVDDRVGAEARVP